MSSVSIATKPQVYQTFRFIDNKVWNALSEYIDNSLSSFLDKDNNAILRSINPNGKLTVKIDFDLDNDTIRIEDNAFGIDDAHYERAFQLAELPLDTTNLNEFGMGMKVSSIWLADLWTVETKAYGESVKKIFTFDLKEVLRDQRETLDYITEPAEKEEHYTIITLNKLSKKSPSRRQIPFIISHLTDIYTKYIREGIIDIIIDGEAPLQTRQLEILKAPYWKDDNGEDITWYHKIDFPPVPKMVDGKQEGFYRVSGFIALLATQSTSKDNGIFLFHKGRVVDNSNEGKFRPIEICGQPGSPRYKRVFGELELEGYDVTYTKNAFNEDDDFHQLILDIIQDVEESGLDLFGQAQNYTKKTKEETTDIAAKFISSITTSGREPSSGKKKKTQKVVAPQPIVVPDVDTIESSNDPDISASEFFLSEPQTMEVTICGSSIKLILSATENANSDKLYSVREIENKKEYEAIINWKNSYFKNIDFSIEQQLDSIAYFIKIMVLTEVMLLIKGTSNSGAFRNTFNSLFGQVI